MTRRRVRLTNGETEAQRARRLAEIAWASATTQMHPHDLRLEFGDEMQEMFCAGYAAALEDEVPPQALDDLRRGG
jgi:hypothetical protein